MGGSWRALGIPRVSRSELARTEATITECVWRELGPTGALVTSKALSAKTKF